MFAASLTKPICCMSVNAGKHMGTGLRTVRLLSVVFLCQTLVKVKYEKHRCRLKKISGAFAKVLLAYLPNSNDGAQKRLYWQIEVE